MTTTCEELDPPDHKDTVVAWPAEPDVGGVGAGLPERLARLLTFLGKRAADRALTPDPTSTAR